ncbi:MAG: YjjG family noncanonical pyrimidine nucleotidase [Roseburia sp.]|nr:YjjG family noncanonical pyrimidine nucleotidase [Roseburia sp.]
METRYGFTTILWDVDNTLLDFHYSQRHSLEKCFRDFNLAFSEEILERYDRINNSYWRRLELGEITKPQLLRGRFVTLFEEFRIDAVDLEAFLADYQEGLGTIYACLDDSLEICGSLLGKVKQYVVTNGVSHTQRNKLRLSGLADFMEELFISEEIGVPKPQKGFFDYCLSHIEERDRKRILLVGDSVSSDIRGGVQAGIATCWYRRAGTENLSEYQPDYEIEDLHQIMEILQIR